MTPPRIPEAEGVSGADTVASYDKLMRKLMQKGYLDTAAILQAGIRQGSVLEVGPGPGYLGIDWLARTAASQLTGLDISPDMIALAERNAQQYQVAERANYVLGDARQMPFADGSFDAVFTNGSLHEWADPVAVFNEIHRVLRRKGLYCITDLRRDISIWAKMSIQLVIPSERKAGFTSSLQASYTVAEANSLVRGSSLRDSHVTKGFWTLLIRGEK